MPQNFAIGLNAVIVSVTNNQPKVLIVRDRTGRRQQKDSRLGNSTNRDSLPFGPFYPKAHRTFAEGLRSWVTEQTGQALGYVEQLYTFGDQGRIPGEEKGGPRVISVGYLGLVNETTTHHALHTHAVWQDWYSYFPWEDWRRGVPPILHWLTEQITIWANDHRVSQSERNTRTERACIAFGLDDTPWNGRIVLERYELLYEAGLVAEHPRYTFADATSGRAMAFDHRRILATAMGRLRGKIKYRPVVFELMPCGFTLLQLQRCVEGLCGEVLHKQNFRRLVDSRGLVEATGRTVRQISGRPAAEFRFRKGVLRERQALGL